EDFDITAERDGRLLTFGAGAHYCLGANLARAELEEALAFLAPRMPGLAAAGPARLGGIEGIYGIHELPLRWDPHASTPSSASAPWSPGAHGGRRGQPAALAHLQPQLLVAARGRAARRERGHRGPLHRHLLDQRQRRDRGGGHVVALRRKLLEDLAVQPLAPV